MCAANVQKFEVEGNLIAYQKIGAGPNVLLAFHGFGQTNRVFESLESSLGDQFTIFALDLFFHGDSSYQSNQLLTKADWQRFIAAFLREKNVNRFSLMGFSLGGRFALSTVEGFADRVDQLILIAPDGITRNIWYRIATGSRPGRLLFRYMLRHLSMLNKLGQGLAWIGLLNRTIVRFAELSLGTPEQRERVYQSWTLFRLIQPDLSLISKQLTTHLVWTRFFTGAFDRIVPGSYILPLTKRLPHFELTILQTGHNRLIDMTAAHLIEKTDSD
ncbi:hypothetical protein GCM10028805_34980 [Spirosoma harenae]